MPVDQYMAKVVVVYQKIVDKMEAKVTMLGSKKEQAEKRAQALVDKLCEETPATFLRREIASTIHDTIGPIMNSRGRGRGP